MGPIGAQLRPIEQKSLDYIFGWRVPLLGADGKISFWQDRYVEGSQEQQQEADASKNKAGAELTLSSSSGSDGDANDDLLKDWAKQSEGKAWTW